MIAIGVDVAELELFSLGKENLNFVGAPEFDGGSGAGMEVSKSRLDESGLPPLGAVKHVEHEVRCAVVVDYSSFANISWRWHGLKSKSESEQIVFQ